MIPESKAPDGGWGWVVVAGSAVCQMLTVGLLWALSILYVSWLDEFDQGKGLTSWVISLGFSLLFAAGPISASLAARYGCRAVVIAGGLMTSAGLILSFWATSLEYLILAIGLFTGLGCGLSYVPAMAMVPIYFNRRRSLASGMSMSGVGIGSFLLAPLLDGLETSYGWRGTILILGALTLNIVLCGAVMRPLYSNTADDVNVAPQQEKCDDCVKPSQEEQNNVDENSKFIAPGCQTDCGISDAKGITDTVRIKQLKTRKEDSLSKWEIQIASLKDDCGDEHSPFLISSEKEIHCSSREPQIMETVPLSATQSNLPDHKGEQYVSNAGVQIVLPVIKDGCGDALDDPREKVSKQKPVVEVDLLKVAAAKVSGSMNNIETSRDHRQLNVYEHRVRSETDLRARHSMTHCADYPYTRSAECFKNLLLASTPALSHADVTDNPHHHANQSAKISDCVFTMTKSKSNKLSSSKRKRLFILKEYIQEAMSTNKELVKDLPFMILAISHMLSCNAALTSSVYMVDRMVFQGIDKSIGAIIVSVASAFNFFGRIFFGYAADRLCKDHMALYIGTVGVSGVSTLLSPLCGANVYLHGLYAVVFGFTTGGSSTLTFVVNVDVMGVARVASSYGLLLTFMGLGNLVGMPMAGWLFDWTRTYTIPYIVQGLLLVTADVMLIGLYVCMYKSGRKLTGSEAVVRGT